MYDVIDMPCKTIVGESYLQREFIYYKTWFYIDGWMQRDVTPVRISKGIKSVELSYRYYKSDYIVKGNIYFECNTSWDMPSWTGDLQ